MDQPPWWAYIIMSIFGFIGLMILNLIINRINGTRIEERYALAMAKAARNAPEAKKPHQPCQTTCCPPEKEEPTKCDPGQHKTVEFPQGNEVESSEPAEISLVGRACMHVEPDDDAEGKDPKTNKPGDTQSK